MGPSRKKLISDLTEMVVVRKVDQFQVEVGSIYTRILPNLLTAHDCQIFESIFNSKSQTESGIGPHVHLDSREIFYQLVGETAFTDGTVLKAGDIKIVEAGEGHGLQLAPGSRLITIAHPPIEELPKGTD